MSTRAAGEHDPSLATVMGERRHLMNLAYRLLGSLADAEDAVQETYVRWYGLSREQRDAVRSPGAWLTTVASRICLDLGGPEPHETPALDGRLRRPGLPSLIPPPITDDRRDLTFATPSGPRWS